MMAEARVVATNIGFTEGPVWTQDGRLIVTSISRGCLYEIGAGPPRAVATTRGGPNGMTEGRDGTLYVTQNSGLFAMSVGDNSPDPIGAGVQIVEGESVRYLAEGLDAPNDLCFGPGGRLYFTDPRGGPTPADLKPGRVYALTLDGQLELLVEGPRFTNGIGFGLDATELYVAETFGQRVLVYPFRDGALGEPREFCRTDPGFPDGFCFDEAGRLYLAATVGHEIQVFDRDGTRVDRLPCGEGSMPTNCCFGGADGRTLFVTDSAGERVLAFDLDAAGLPLFPFR
jgi:gluconolactonase